MFEGEKLKTEAIRLLEGLEDGNLDFVEAYRITEKMDPVVIYFVMRFLREKYPPNNPASQGVVERMIKFTTDYDQVVKLAKKGEKDPLKEWFDDAYSMREFFPRPEELISELVEKLEG